MTPSKSGRPAKSTSPLSGKAKGGGGARPVAVPPQEVRIIGGSLRRRKIPVANKPGLRPTPDRVRETLFNWLGQDLSLWRCADVFAGSGALGFEAASRGASFVQMFESDGQLARSLEQVTEKLGLGSVVAVRKIDGILGLGQVGKASLDLVFLDPPFDSDLMPKALRAALGVIKPQGWLYIESGKAMDQPVAQELGLQLFRQMKAGQVVAQLFQFSPSAVGSADAIDGSLIAVQAHEAEAD
jgi:16S rRNA (guanine966-N2)-methyltransferase